MPNPTSGSAQANSRAELSVKTLCTRSNPSMKCCTCGVSWSRKVNLYIIIVFATFVAEISCGQTQTHLRHSQKAKHRKAAIESIDIAHANVDSNRPSSDQILGDYDSFIFDSTQGDATPMQMGGVDIREEAKKLAFKLRMLSNEEMGVTGMQSIFDSLPFSEIQPTYHEKLNQLVEKVTDKLGFYLNVLKSYKEHVEYLYSIRLGHPVAHQFECCNVPSSDLRWDEQQGCSVSSHASCDLVPPSLIHPTFNPGRNLTEVYQKNVQLIPAIKWQYFISRQGLHNEFPAHSYPSLLYSDCKNVHDLRHRDIYLATVHPQRKNIVIVVDHGNSLSHNQLQIAKSIAKHVLYSLTENDRVGVIGLSDKAVFPREDGCISHSMATLTYEAKLYFSAFIDKLDKQKISTDHVLGFQEAFQMVWNTLSNNNTTYNGESALILYISRGLMSSLTDKKDVLKTIAQQNARTNFKVVINTYAVIDDGKPIIYEKNFLQNVASQDFTTYLDHLSSHRIAPRGKMVAVNTTRDLSSVVGGFTDSLNLTNSRNPHISLPIKDEVGTGVVLPITWPCYYNKQLLGVAGFDLHLSDLVEDITYYNDDDHSYAFLLDKQGYAVMHPALRRPILSNVQPMHASIRHYEKAPGFNLVYDAMMKDIKGEMSLQVPRSPDNMSFVGPVSELHAKVKITYLWKHINVTYIGLQYILVLRVRDDGFKLNHLSDLHASNGQQLVYHRLDLLPTDHTCLHLKQLATLDTSAVFLSAAAFRTPFEHLHQEETKRMVQGYLAYINDNTGLINNPAFFKDSIRKDICAVTKINTEWLQQYKNSHLNNYIVRRYVATPSGVFQMYPGTLLHKTLDPTKRGWYMRTVEHPGKVTFTAPYLDEGGAGYIVTLSHTVYEGKHTIHGPFDEVTAVMGMDMTLKYFYKLLIDQMAVCEHPHIRCFVMDDRGYLIAHKGLIEPNGRGPLEEKHITHKEPLVANDLLNHEGFVRKKLCNSFTDRTIQRFYKFNTSLDGVITNLVHGEHCAKYQVTAVPGTNAFLGIVNQTCEMMRAFCPCSMIDRLCLNCHRMEQTECECPCECPLETDFCTTQLLYASDDNPSCDRYPEEIPLVKVSAEVSEKLPQCFPTHCSSHKTKRDCMGVLDCEWCELQADAKSILAAPYCSTQRICFSGVLGASTPYHDAVKYPQAAQVQGEQPSFKSTPVGPVAGGIMGCFLVLALGVYCYRHHVQRHGHQYMTSLPDSHLRHSQNEFEIEELDSPDDPSGHTNIMLASFENPASVSPYRVNTTYRRPTHAESDLGYSTMTPHEDSEQASTTCVEPLIISRDRYRPPPTTQAKSSLGGTVLPPPPPSTVSSRRSQSPTPTSPTSSGISSPTTTLPPILFPPTPATPLNTTLPTSMQTVLPSDLLPNQVLASVQVHMVDTH